jgi:hypothetical protein
MEGTLHEVAPAAPQVLRNAPARYDSPKGTRCLNQITDLGTTALAAVPCTSPAGPVYYDHLFKFMHLGDTGSLFFLPATSPKRWMLMMAFLPPCRCGQVVFDQAIRA